MIRGAIANSRRLRLLISPSAGEYRIPGIVGTYPLISLTLERQGELRVRGLLGAPTVWITMVCLDA